MKTRSKALLLASSAVLLVAGSVLGTLAYLTDREAAVNTFTIGSVDISLVETDVDGDGDPLNNEYRLVPGEKYVKDPTLTVDAGSESAYVRMILTIHNWDAAKELIFVESPSAETPFAALGGYDGTKWIFEGSTEDVDANTVSIEYRYYQPESGIDHEDGNELPALFTELNVPTDLDGTGLQRLYDGGFKMVVEGHAIQAAGFADADTAWAAFDEQVNE